MKHLQPFRITLAIVAMLGALAFGGESTRPLLTVYTYDSFAADWGPGPKVKAAFEREHNCTLVFVPSSSAIGSLRKIQLEGNTTQADLLLGLDTSTVEMAKATGLFAKHTVDTSGLTLPVAWHDDRFVPYDYAYFAFVYDSNKTAKVPASLEELASMPKDFKIIIEDPRSSTPGLGLLLWVKSEYGNKAADYWKRLAPHILTITKGWSEAYNLFLKGEADMVLSYTTSPAYHMIVEKKFQYKTANFAKGHYGQIEVAGILKSSKHPKLAQAFLDFITSETFADIVPATNWTYPVVKTTKGLPEGFEKLYRPARMLLMESQTVQTHRKAWINEWLQALSR